MSSAGGAQTVGHKQHMFTFSNGPIVTAYLLKLQTFNRYLLFTAGNIASL